MRIFIPAFLAFTVFLGAFFYLYYSQEAQHHPLIKVIETACFIGVLAAVLYPLARIYFFSEQLHSSFQTLTDAALSVAAGEYKIPIQVKGPQEIADLANAMRTMSECLQENIDRLRETSSLRERMHGEYECAMLLQQFMLNKVIEQHSNKHFSIRSVTYRATSAPHGVLLKLPTDRVEFFDANESGFEGMYDLLSHGSSQKTITLSFNEPYTSVTTQVKGMPLPMLWSFNKEKLNALSSGTTPIEKDDIIFLYNNGFAKCFDSDERIQKWFHKVLRHFATEGTELFFTMLNCELNFLTQKQHIEHDINILCIQIL